MTERLSELPGGYSLPDSLCFDLVPARGGEPYRIFTSRSGGDAPPEGWPVLYLTDGNATFPIAASSHAFQSVYPVDTNIGQGVIVAIGYPTDGPYEMRRRAWDLTPPPGRTYPPRSPDGPEIVTGGAGEFLAFIETELKPVIAEKFRVDPARQTLFGHSFGGLFTLHTLFENPATFNRYVAASPSIFWEDRCILDFEAGFSLESDIAERLLHLSAGEFEGERLAPFIVDADDASVRRMAQSHANTFARTEELAARLTAAFPTGLSVRYETFEGETHISVLPSVIGRALQIAFARVDLTK